MRGKHMIRKMSQDMKAATYVKVVIMVKDGFYNPCPRKSLSLGVTQQSISVTLLRYGFNP